MTGGARPRQGGAPHLLVVSVEEPEPDDAARHHLGRVRRLRDGEPLTVTDGAGRWRWCRWVGGGVEADGPVAVEARPVPEITVAFALTKSEKPESVVQKLTELGVDAVVAFAAERSVVRWDDGTAERNVARWRVVARGALEQSGGVWLPDVRGVLPLPALTTLGARRLDRGGAPPSLAHPAVAVGPEGGWSDAERSVLPDSVGLVPTVLRAETAAVTAGALYAALRAGTVTEMRSDVYGA